MGQKYRKMVDHCMGLAFQGQKNLDEYQEIGKKSSILFTLQGNTQNFSRTDLLGKDLKLYTYASIRNVKKTFKSKTRLVKPKLLG